ncbi:hypothetical protein STEG23_030860, partial [Scotinomys teguina]
VHVKYLYDELKHNKGMSENISKVYHQNIVLTKTADSQKRTAKQDKTGFNRQGKSLHSKDKATE